MKKVIGFPYTIFLELFKKLILNVIQNEPVNEKRPASWRYRIGLTDTLFSCSFPELFEVLERDELSLGVVSFGLSLNTLEQVFLKYGIPFLSLRALSLYETGKDLVKERP